MKTSISIYYISFVLACAFNFKGYAQVQKTDGLQNKPEVISIAGKTGGEITKDELLNSKGLESSDSTHHVSEYHINIIRKEIRSGDGKSVCLISYPGGQSVKGNELTQSMKNAIKDAPSGTRIDFENIYCYPKYKSWHKVGSLNFIIK